MSVGIIAIGRNEGERLRLCLASAVGRARLVVYVDSGSTDGSVALAESMGANVVRLDVSVPFTAARARNAGFERLLGADPGVELAQFVDGDCEIRPGWLELAERELRARPDVVAVFGRRRERFPEATIYNRMCDIEWDGFAPIGESPWCGGDAMFRAGPLRDVGGYNPAVIAGEEPELCVRLRGRGWKVWRLDAEMTLHDAAMTTFGQWWRRQLRAGHAYAEGYHLHGGGPTRHFAKEVLSNYAWGVGLPLLAVLFAWPTRGLSLLLVPIAYGLLFAKVYRWARRSGVAGDRAGVYSLFCAVGKLPNACGQVRYLTGRLLGRRSGLIEYKAPVAETEGMGN